MAIAFLFSIENSSWSYFPLLLHCLFRSVPWPLDMLPFLHCWPLSDAGSLFRNPFYSACLGLLARVFRAAQADNLLKAIIMAWFERVCTRLGTASCELRAENGTGNGKGKRGQSDRPACCGNLLPAGRGGPRRGLKGGDPYSDPWPCCTLRYLHMKCVKLSSFLAQVCFSEQIAGEA